MHTVLALKNRIHLLQNRTTENQRIIQKLQRMLKHAKEKEANKAE